MQDVDKPIVSEVKPIQKKPQPPVPEKDEAEDDPANAEDSKSNLENCKYYTSLFLGTLCLVSFICLNQSHADT